MLPVACHPPPVPCQWLPVDPCIVRVSIIRGSKFWGSANRADFSKVTHWVFEESTVLACSAGPARGRVAALCSSGAWRQRCDRMAGNACAARFRGFALCRGLLTAADSTADDRGMWSQHCCVIHTAMGDHIQQSLAFYAVMGVVPFEVVSVSTVKFIKLANWRDEQHQTCWTSVLRRVMLPLHCMRW